MAAAPMPVVQGFTFTATDPIPNIDKLKKNPTAKEWGEIQEVILASGDKLFNTTKRGDDHPVQTKNIRIDYQGTARDNSCANQQAQHGGTTVYKAGKNESTSFSCVHVDFRCQGMPSVNLALQRAHNYSYAVGMVVHITPAQAAAPAAAPAPVAAAATTVCTNTECNAEITLQSWMKTGSTQYCEECGTSFIIP